MKTPSDISPSLNSFIARAVNCWHKTLRFSESQKELLLTTPLYISAVSAADLGKLAEPASIPQQSFRFSVSYNNQHLEGVFISPARLRTLRDESKENGWFQILPAPDNGEAWGIAICRFSHAPRVAYLLTWQGLEGWKTIRCLPFDTNTGQTSYQAQESSNTFTTELLGLIQSNYSQIS